MNSSSQAKTDRGCGDASEAEASRQPRDFAEELSAALCSFGTYPDEWDHQPGKTRLEVRIESPAGKWAATCAVWRLSELQRAKQLLRDYQEAARAGGQREASASQASPHAPNDLVRDEPND